MSVRRLAPPEIQPKSFGFTAENLAWAKAEMTKYPEGRQASAIIPLLWRAQAQSGGWLPEAAIRHVADLLSLARRSIGSSLRRLAARRRSRTFPYRQTPGANDARGQGSHLQESLRPPRLGARGRAGARRLGRHQRHPGKRPRLDHQQDEGVRPARPRRPRISDRAQVVLHAQTVRRPPALAPDQR